MEDEAYMPTPWNDREPIVYNRGDTLKQMLPNYLKRIREHYESSSSSSSAGDRLKGLSPFVFMNEDFHRKWSSRCHRYNDWGTVIMNIAPSVVSVSIFNGVQRKVDCTGLVIYWDDSTSEATVITCAKLLRIPQDEDRDDYYIVVRLPNGNILLAEEHYVDYYHNIITLKVGSESKLKPIGLHSPPPEEGMEVVALSRDFYSCRLLESSGIIHMDYPYFGCELLVSSTCSGSQDGEGGPLITRTGHVCGINFFDGHKSFHPLPTSVIRSCLDTGASHCIVVQPWLGLTVIDIADLPCDVLEVIPRVCCDAATAATVVIKEVYEGSPADEAGVRPGDLVISLDKSPISCASQVSVHASDLHEIKLVCARNLLVDDRRFCCCWPGDEYDLFRNEQPLLGSQTDCAFDVGANDELPSWLLHP